MFIDELTITAKAGRGGDGVVRWRREKSIPFGGPAGGNGGKGGDVYMRAVRDVGMLAKYTGAKEFTAENGHPGAKRSKYGKHGEDLYIEVPVGARVTDRERGRVYTFSMEGETHKILRGGTGGLGNEYFKSSTNRSPEQATKGKKGDHGTFHIELTLVVDIGLVGLPNAGKSTLINALTNTHARVGSYPFTTVEPHLGELYGFIVADIPGLIEGASEGKGLGHKFLRHITRTKMIVHCVSLEHDDVLSAYKTIREELRKFGNGLEEKEEWIVLTKSDLVTDDVIERAQASLMHVQDRIYVVSGETKQGIKDLSEALVAHCKTL